MNWSQNQIEFLIENYPKRGKDWCVREMNMSEGQIRSKASRLQLKARGVSSAWAEKQISHGNILRGRKRPDQSLVMKKMYEEGKIKKVKTPDQCEAISIRVKNWLSQNEHPRGAKGMKHTPEAKQKMSAALSNYFLHDTEDKKIERIKKMMQTREKNGTVANPRVNTSWKGGWREIGGVRKYFRSRWEANYARYLEWLKGMRQIKSWAHEPKTFWFEGIKRGCVSYLPDFFVVEIDGKEGYHEVKGWFDARSKTKIARMAKYYPEVKLIVIDGKLYKAIEKSASKFIPDWEYQRANQ